MYQGIDDMSQGAWRKLEKTDDLTLLFKDSPKKLKRKQKFAARQRHQEIKDQKFDEIDMNDDLELHILKMVDREILKTKYLIEPDNHLLTLIMKLDMEIGAETDKGDSSDKAYYTSKGHIEKFIGGGYIDESKISMRGYHVYSQMLREESERIEAINLKNRKKP